MAAQRTERRAAPSAAQLALDRVRPSWLTGGMIRLGVLSAFVVLVGMIRSRMTARRTRGSSSASARAAAAGELLFAVGSLRLTERMSLSHRAAGILLLFRRTGLPLLGLAFFLAVDDRVRRPLGLRSAALRRARPAAALRRLLLLRGLDGVHLAARATSSRRAAAPAARR